MATFVYITEKCEQDIRRLDYQTTVDRFRQRVESDAGTALFDHYPRPYLKKRFTRQTRLVAEARITPRDTVILFLRLLVRSSKEYRGFIDSNFQRLPGYDTPGQHVDDSALESFLAKRRHQAVRPPMPAVEEAAYLQAVLGGTKNIYQDYHFLETGDWVEKAKESRFQARCEPMRKMVFDTISCEGDGLQTLTSETERGLGIVFRVTHGSQQAVVLFTPFFDGNPPLGEIRGAYSDLLTPGELDHEKALRRVKRSYPFTLLESLDAWSEVQRDAEGSMALSMEEIEVLDSVRPGRMPHENQRRGGTPSQYPLFINGRAGSGKSTILQYIFSEYLLHYFRSGRETAPPAFFACNDELLGRAETVARRLMSSMAEGKLESLVPNQLESVFLNFHKWLHCLAPERVFPIERLVEYGTFKAWWERAFAQERSARRLHGPDISWHVIRSFIKGMDVDGYVGPEDYEELARRQQSVKNTTFSLVFEKVWSRYQAHQDETGAWDYQDLARYVLKHNLIDASRPVVFCDEAQDFTRIELEILYRTNLFTRRTIHPHECSLIPYAFAGDPFQTLNPTGFRWEATKAFFVEKFIAGFQGETSRELNYRELQFNYRSNQHIVDFTNTLQLARSVVFRFSEIQPQIPWLDETHAPNVMYFNRDSVDVKAKLRDQEEIRIIVPCEEGDEKEWARQNDLQEFVKFDDAGVPKNVVSPMRVKGLEFARVVLFGFADACPNMLQGALEALTRIDASDPDDSFLTGDQAVEPQYFMNKLYVAASRPRRRLFIVDSERGINGFWLRLFQRADGLAEHSAHPEVWLERCGSILKGDLESWNEDREDPEETANKLAEEARYRQDAVLYRQAAQSFEHAALMDRSRKCRAEALELEERFIDAARTWMSIHDVDRAVRAAWRAKAPDSHDFIVGAATQNEKVQDTIQWKFARFFKESPSYAGWLEDAVTLLEDLERCFENKALAREIIRSPSWKEAATSVIDYALGRARQLTEPTDSRRASWKLLEYAAEKLLNRGLSVGRARIGQVAFRAGDLERAYDHWESLPADERRSFERDFLRARCEKQGYPGNVESYNEMLRKFEEKADAEAFLALLRSESDEGSKSEALCRARFLVADYVGAAEVSTVVGDGILLVRLGDRLAAARESRACRDVVARLFLITAEDLGGAEALRFALSMGSLGSREALQRSLAAANMLAAWRASGSLEGACAVAEFAARCDRLEEVPATELLALAEFLGRNFGAILAWCDTIHPILVGRAYERAGRFVQTLAFYEKVIGSEALSEETRRLAGERWAIVKMDHADWEEARRGSPDKVRERREEAEARAVSLGFGSVTEIRRTLPNILPRVRAGSRGASVGEASPATMSSSRLSQIAVKFKKDKVILCEQESDERAYVDLVSRRVTLEGDPVSADAGVAYLADWGIWVYFEDGGDILLRITDSEGASRNILAPE